MDAQLSHREAKSLFMAALDDELAVPDERRLRTHLDGCDDCRQGWDRYARAVQTLRSVDRERAPKALSTVIMRRIRRRRPFAYRAQLTQFYYRVPMEAIIPVLLGILMAAFLVLVAP